MLVYCSFDLWTEIYFNSKIEWDETFVNQIIALEEDFWNGCVVPKRIPLLMDRIPVVLYWRRTFVNQTTKVQ